MSMMTECRNHNRAPFSRACVQINLRGTIGKETEVCRRLAMGAGTTERRSRAGGAGLGGLGEAVTPRVVEPPSNGRVRFFFFVFLLEEE